MKNQQLNAWNLHGNQDYKRAKAGQKIRIVCSVRTEQPNAKFWLALKPKRVIFHRSSWGRSPQLRKKLNSKTMNKCEEHSKRWTFFEQRVCHVCSVLGCLIWNSAWETNRTENPYSHHKNSITQQTYVQIVQIANRASGKGSNQASTKFQLWPLKFWT